MKTNLINELRCPNCGSTLSVDDESVAPTYGSMQKELNEGLLACSNCAANYPVICGMAVLLPNVKSWLRNNYYYVAEGALNNGGIGGSLAQYLDKQGWRMSASPANNYYELPRWVEIFLATHYDPIQAGADDDSELGTLLSEKQSVFDYINTALRDQTSGRIGRALDVGANVGGMTWRLAEFADSVVAIDTAFNPMLAARKIQLGLPTPQNKIRRYLDGIRHEEIEVGPYPGNVEFLIASLFGLPIEGRFDVITALNVIDVMPDPEAFLDTLIERLLPDGLLVLTSPYSWGSDDTPIDNWLGDENTPSSDALRHLLVEKGLTIEKEADLVPWVLREHVRWYRVFHNHCLIVKKA